jgi:hypothetical protein
MLHEAEVFTMASHLHWSLWSFPMAVSEMAAHTSFNYVEYGRVRFNEFLRLKSEYLSRRRK